MSRQANPTLIGAFVLGALALAVVTTLLLAGGSWFGQKRQHMLYFDGAPNGLQVGAPVMFRGVKVGTVKQIQLGLDGKSGPDRHFVVPVTIEVLPDVVRAKGGEPVDLRDPAVVRGLVERGLRARLRLQSLLTGQLYVDLDFHPDKPAQFVGLDPSASEIPTIRTAVQEMQARLDAFPMEQFLADVTAISGAIKALMTAQGTQELPQRLQATLKHLEALAARLDAEGGPTLRDARKALVAAQRALAKLETAADRVAKLTADDSDTMKSLAAAADELAKAAGAVRSLTERESPTVQQTNAALKEIARAADALRKLAETLEDQPDAIYRGKRRKHEP
jgi:paraquat-inducible protein B